VDHSVGTSRQFSCRPNGEQPEGRRGCARQAPPSPFPEQGCLVGWKGRVGGLVGGVLLWPRSERGLWCGCTSRSCPLLSLPRLHPLPSSSHLPTARCPFRRPPSFLRSPLFFCSLSQTPLQHHALDLDPNRRRRPNITFNTTWRRTFRHLIPLPSSATCERCSCPRENPSPS
jgi:hypothetical protein